MKESIPKHEIFHILISMFETKNKIYDCENCLFRIISCKFLNTEEFELIRRTSTQMRYDKGETILRQGGKSQNLLFLHKGIVKFNYKNEADKNFIMTIVKGPKLLGGANLFFKDTNIFSVIAVEDCELCLIDSRAVKSILLKHGNYMLMMSEQTVDMFSASIFNFISLAHKQVNGRIADILLYLNDFVYKDSGFEFTLSRKEIAEFAACSHENVINTLSRFNKEGVIKLEGKKISITDFPKLKEISRLG